MKNAAFDKRIAEPELFARFRFFFNAQVQNNKLNLMKSTRDVKSKCAVFLDIVEF
jgi:hypothetical protein